MKQLEIEHDGARWFVLSVGRHDPTAGRVFCTLISPDGAQLIGEWIADWKVV